MAAQVNADFEQTDTPFDFEYENDIVGEQKTEFDQKLVAAVCQEMMKMFKNKGGETSYGAGVPKHHAGSPFYTALHALSCHVALDLKEDWIVDTGATDHMSPYLHLFTSIRVLKKPIKMLLPDGTCKLVTKIGSVQLNPSLILSNVFYVPDFQINLLSVGKLLQFKHLIAVFHSEWFAFQDPSTNK